MGFSNIFRAFRWFSVVLKVGPLKITSDHALAQEPRLGHEAMPLRTSSDTI